MIVGHRECARTNCFPRRMQFSRQNVRARHQLQLTIDGEDVCVCVWRGGGGEGRVAGRDIFKTRSYQWLRGSAASFY